MKRGPYNTEEKFWSHVIRGDNCWIWSRRLDKDGYGLFSWRGKLSAKAHRVAYAISFLDGELPPVSVLVLHSCNNPKCVKPDHLRLGTHGDNMIDRKQIGNYPGYHGENNSASKLTEDNVRKIRHLYNSGIYSQQQIGDMFNVGQNAIYKVVNYKTWKDI